MVEREGGGRDQVKEWPDGAGGRNVWGGAGKSRLPTRRSIRAHRKLLPSLLPPRPPPPP